MPETSGKGFPSTFHGRNNPEIMRAHPEPFAKRLFLWGLYHYLRRYHGFRVTHPPEGLPDTGPFLAYVNHGSNLDPVALMDREVDPYYPPSSAVVKVGLVRAPLVRSVIKYWDPIPVNRDGNDHDAVREIFTRLRDGQGVLIFAEGTRSKTGRMQPFDEGFITIAIMCAQRGIALIPVAVDTYDALPRDAKIPVPRPRKITVTVGPPVDMRAYSHRHRLSDEEKGKIALYLREKITAMLPEHRRPLPGTKPIWRYDEYVKRKKE